MVKEDSLYDDIIKILKQENTKSRFREIKKMKKYVPKEKEEKVVSNMATNFIGINHGLNNQEKDVINEYVETQKFDFKVVLGGKPGRALKQTYNEQPHNVFQPVEGFQQPHNVFQPVEGFQQPHNEFQPVEGFQQPHNEFHPVGFQQPHNGYQSGNIE